MKTTLSQCAEVNMTMLERSSREDQCKSPYEFGRQRILKCPLIQWAWTIFPFLEALSPSKNASWMGTAPSTHAPVLPDRRLRLYRTVPCLGLQTPLEWCTHRPHTRSYRGFTSGEWYDQLQTDQSSLFKVPPPKKITQFIYLLSHFSNSYDYVMSM